MIEDPGSASGPLGLRESGVQIRVDVEADDAGLPFDRVPMKSIRKVLTGGKAERGCGVARAARGAWAVKRAVHGSGLFADVFHDVDFAAPGPAGGRDVVAEHPKSRPHSLPFRDFDASFKAAVSLGEKPLGLEPSGSVVVRRAV